MGAYKTVTIRKGREAFYKNRHPWIFSGAIEILPKIEPGEICRVVLSDGACVGYGYFNPKCDLVGRMLTWQEESPEAVVKRKLLSAITCRSNLFGMHPKAAVRLINAEADGLPGLIVDMYGRSIVVQISTYGMERLKTVLVQELCEKIQPEWIYEKSTSPSRMHEGLVPVEQTLYGTEPANVIIEEGGIKHYIPIRTGQKSGFFIDQRDMRELVGKLSYNKRVLNCFSYTGGFSLAAMKGGARHVTSVDYSNEAIALLQKNIELNGLHSVSHDEKIVDAFEFLRENSLEYDLIILDPPAFTKSKKDTKQAERGYREINFQVFKKAAPNTLLITSSCSYFFTEDNLRTVLFQAARTAAREVTILSKHRNALDHGESLFAPVGGYLKSFVLYIR